MRYNIPIYSIVLWMLGGIAQRFLPSNWRTEFSTAIAGPFVSGLLGSVFYIALLVIPPQLGIVQFVIGYLVLLNVGLTGFNLLPAFPMGGGRILRALPARSRSYPVATQAATEVGKVIAVIPGGIGALLPNIWLIAIAIFVSIGALSTTRQAVLARAFQNIQVQDPMTAAADVETVS